MHRSDGAGIGAGVDAMKLNRKTQPLVYTRVATRAERAAEKQKRADQVVDVALAIIGFWMLVVLFAVAG